jgi:hypothetical protein
MLIRRINARSSVSIRGRPPTGRDEAAQKSWRRLDGHNHLPKLVLVVKFNDGVEVIVKPTDRQLETAAA